MGAALSVHAAHVARGNTRVTIAMPSIRVLEYLDPSGLSPFRRWFDDLDGTAAARVGRAQAVWQDYKRRKRN